mgnify:CR=1 FL=1
MLTNNHGNQIQALPEKLRKLNPRQLRWVWHQVSLKTTPLKSVNIHDPVLRTQDIALYLSGLDEDTQTKTIDELLYSLEEGLLPEAELDWIKHGNYRVLIYLRIELYKLGLITPPPNAIYSQLFLDGVILAIDTLQQNYYEKLKTVLSLKEHWNLLLSSDNYSKWINPRNEDQIAWSWEYLRDKQQQHSDLLPTNLEEKYQAILSSLDYFSCDHIAERKVFIDKMKRSWAQKKYRETDKAKKQRSLPMSDETKKQLDHIALANDERINETLMRIIQKEFNQTKQRS